MITYKQLQEKSHIEVYSIQKRYALERLKQGNIYIPQIKKSAAYDISLGETSCLAHRRAYRWMAAQFKKQMGRRPLGAFFWVWFDEAVAERAKKPEDRCMVKLYVPVHELLISIHRGWLRVLDPLCLPWSREKTNPIAQLNDRKYVRKSWENIFSCDNDPLCELQGVIDRVEPGWIREIVLIEAGDRESVS